MSSTELQAALDCTHGRDPTIIHCPVDQPCAMHRIELLTHQLNASRTENAILRDRLMTANADLHTARYELAKTRKP